jgi:hypothetical protein
MSKIDIEAFVRKWWSQADINYHFDLQEWMRRSYTDPLPFWEELAALYPIDPTSQTIPLQQYDFYADCILRHLGRNSCALKVIKAEGQAETWSYDQIHEMVDAQAFLWKTSGLEPGKTVALILPQGLPYVIGLMTALRLGLAVSILPLDDRFFPKSQLVQALEILNPNLIVTLPENKLDVSGKILELDLSLQKQTSSPIESYAYLPSDIVQKHYNPYAKEKISLLEAMRSYLIPLRDALLALHLKHSMTWARPLASMSREEPCSTLMALLAGATIVYVPDDLLLSNPEVLKNEPIDVLGVSPVLQELWIKNPGYPASKLKLWYRDPLWGNDHNWKAFNELNHLQKIPASQLLIIKERGGITLFSQPKPLEMTSFMHPSLGLSWSLRKINASGDLAVGGYGLFHIEPESENQDPLIISQVSDAWMISATTVPLTEGQPYPIQKVEEEVKTLDFIQTCMIVPERHPQHFLNRQFILLIFISPKERHTLQQKKDEWTHKIQHVIQTAVGKAFIPHQIVFYSFYPKMQNKEIDRNWIERQYQKGYLFLKQNRPIYHSLNLLKQSIYEIMAYKTH